VAGAPVVTATRAYERWIAGQTKIVRADLEYKHAMMAADPFSFMRAAYYRWAQLWLEHQPELAAAPNVLGVGDLHVENFGTWRDAEGRLVWGVNDFDETHNVAYTNDLVRLAVSALLAIRMGHLRIAGREACSAILAGYRAGIDGEGRPFVLAEKDRWLRLQAMSDLRDPVRFWTKLGELPPARRVPEEAAVLLNRTLPPRSAPVGYRSRRAGLGSLGHQRVVLLANAGAGQVAREAKALVLSAGEWIRPSRGGGRIHYQTILERAVREPDPMVHVHEFWVIRRLAPDCSRIELTALPAERDEARLLRAMGFEAANIHHGSRPAVVAVRAHLGQAAPKWLRQAARLMAGAITADWKAWRASQRAAAKAKG
jgi:hypothetical protein